MTAIWPPPTDRVRGFTLIEMLVVLSILSLLAAIAASRIGRSPSGLVRQNEIAQFVEATQRAKQAAWTDGETRSLDPSQLPRGARFVPLFGGEKRPAVVTPVFHPDGSSNGGTVTVDGKPIMTIDWLTGEVIRVGS